MSEPRRYAGNGITCADAPDAPTCGTCAGFRRCCGCGSGWCMELLRPVREDEAACEEHDPDAGGRSRG